MPEDAARRRLPVWTFAVLFFGALAGLPWLGAESVSPGGVLSFLRGGEGAQGLIFFQQRLPRVLLALAVGGSLSTAGATLQVLFRNPLAEPWTLGVAGGAAVGAFLAQSVDALQVSLGPLTSTQALALLGSAGVMAVVFVFARRSGGGRTHTLLLAGVTISVISAGLMMLLTYFVSPFRFVSIHRWMMGGLDVLGYGDLLSFAALGGPGLGLLALRTREYDHLALGEDLALGHGVDVKALQRSTLLGVGLATAACVAVAGPIGFVGMIVPHAVRRLSGFEARRVLPGAFLLGGAVLALCDGAARTVLAPTEIPVGVITAVVGGPVFLYLLARK